MIYIDFVRNTKTLPAMVANPPVIMAWISELVSFAKNGLIINGASL
jgi:hypothetical protein